MFYVDSAGENFLSAHSFFVWALPGNERAKEVSAADCFIAQHKTTTYVHFRPLLFLALKEVGKLTQHKLRDRARVPITRGLV